MFVEMVLCYPVYIQKREITPQWDDFPARAGARGACIGGRFRQKRVPFSRFNPVETMAFPHGTASRAAEPATDPQGVRTRRCSAAATVRTAHSMIPQTKKSHERMGEHEQNKNGQKSGVITAFAGNDAVSAADGGVRYDGGRRRHSGRDRLRKRNGRVRRQQQQR